MNGAFVQYALLGALAILLIAAALTDMRSRTIANGLNVAIALLAPAWWLASGMEFWPDMAIQLAIGAAVFGLFTLAFMLGQMGGGDVKLLGALALWLPLIPLSRMLMVMALAGGVITLIAVAAHKVRKRQTPVETPYGVAIAFAGLWAVTERYLYQSA